MQWSKHKHGAVATREQEVRTLTLLAVSDLVQPHIYRSEVVDWLGSVDIIISCGDLPPEYLDFLTNAFHAPLYHVLGNHCCAPHDETGCRAWETYAGAINLHGRTETYMKEDGATLIMAGVEGSPLYNFGPHQYRAVEVERRLLRMAPGLMRSRMKMGRYLDVFVTHSPPRGIHDLPDRAHRGFAPFLPFLKHFRPTLMLHGHTHRYDPTQPTRTQYGPTTIINVYGHALLQLQFSTQAGRWLLPSTEYRV